MTNRWLPLVALLSLSAAACGRQEPLTDPVARGERDFRGLGCAKCHKIGDVGNEWGPNLTLIGFRKSPQWIDRWLKSPHDWNAKSVMPSFHLSDETRADLVAYLAEQKGQAWTEYPWRTPEAMRLPAVTRGKLIFAQAGCVACHGQSGGGGYPNNNVAGGLIPSLTKVSEGYTKKELHDKISNGSVPLPDDPSAPRPLIQMPKWGQQLKSDEIDAVAAYLVSLKPKPAAGAAAKDDF